MAPSTAKRRKVSPSAALPVSVSMPSTPSRIPVPRDGAKTAPGRPSFASPTKASIAKHHPQLLDRPGSAGRDALRLSGKENVPQPAERQLFVQSERGEQVETLEETTPVTGGGAQDLVGEAQRPFTPVTGTNAEGPTRSTNGGFTVPPRRRSRSRTPANDNTRREPLGPVIETPIRRHEADSASAREQTLPPDPFRRSTAIPRSPLNVMPEVAASADESATEAVIPLNPFRTAGLGRSPMATQNVESQRLRTAAREEEPDLPLTPTQRGLADPIVTTPPSGIHNTPSKRSKKRPRGPTRLKSSPLKPQAEPEKDVEPVIPVKRRKIEIGLRHLVPPDPYAEKKRVRDQLLEETRQLQADIALAERENERQRIQHKSRKHRKTEAPDSDEILDLLKRCTASIEPVGPPKKTTVSQSLTSFLPFAKRRRPPPAPPEEMEPPANHLPIKLEEPINHLKLFTPLTFSSAIFLLPPTPVTTTTSPSSDILQSHNITARAPSGLLTARLSMIVNTRNFSISSLNVEKLDTFADPELGMWMRERATSKAVLGRDVNAICWAMGRWYEAAVTRAKFWLTLEAELGTEESRRKSNARIEKAGKLRKGIVDTIEDDVNEGELSSKGQKWTRRHLLPCMGRQNFVLANLSVELRIEWIITFDWTGEAETAISASARVPLSWQQADTRRSLEKVPQTFEALVQTRGPLAASRAMVALLMRD